MKGEGKTVEQYKKSTNQFKQGTKWTLPHKKEGVTSWFGVKESMIERYKDRLQKYGAFDDNGDVNLAKLGVNRFRPCNPDGSWDQTKSMMNIGGRVVNADKDTGVFVIHDKELLDEELEMAMQQDEYTRKILSYCMSSDEIAAKLLTPDGKVSTLKTLLDKGQLPQLQSLAEAVGLNIAISDDLRDVCGLPSYIQVLEGNVRALSISKLKILVRCMNPTIQNEQVGYNEKKEEGAEVN